MKRLQGAMGVLIGALAGMACSDDSPALSAGGQAPSPRVQSPAGTGTALVPLAGSLALGGEFVDNPARVMVTGTLAVTTGGEFAVAADSERDELTIVELGSRSLRRVALTAGDEPARTVAGQVTRGGAHTYTLLRGSAQIVDLNATDGELTRVPTCHAPRGIAYDAARNQVHVACATSELVTYDASTWETRRHLAVARDLRDVVLTERGLLLSRFASAELLLVNDAGEVAVIGEPTVPPACTAPTVMHRLVEQGGNLYAAHQLATNDVVLGRAGDADCAVAQSATVYWRTPLAEVLALTTAGPTASDYWSQFELTLESVPRRDESIEFTHDAHHLARLGESVGPMDLAVSDRGRVVISVAGNFWQGTEPTILAWDHARDAAEGLLSASRPGGIVTSVAFDADGQWLAQSREPAALYFEDGGVLFFGGRSVNNTAYSLFHMNSGAGVACASCHPEGGEDGHVWRFPRGLRRTLQLGAAMSAAGRYTWDGRDDDMHELLSRVLNQQMSHDFVASYEQAEALASWLGTLPAPSAGVITNIGATERGRHVFVEAGCAHCHTEPLYTDRARHDVGSGGSFQTPSLLGVGGRGPLLHDGCAATLRDVLGACGGDSHRLGDANTPQRVSDLVTYLSTL